MEYYCVEKRFLKTFVLTMYGVPKKSFIHAQGTHDILHEQTHIKDAVSRIVVEMIKREWPQQWPSLMQELGAICKLGVSIALLIVLLIVYKTYIIHSHVHIH